MNILCLSELYYPHGGGAELATFLHTQLLSQAGFKIAVVTNKFAGEPAISKHPNMTVYRFPLFKGTSNVKFSVFSRFDFLLSSFLRKMTKWADLVYVPRYWFSGILVAKAFRKPVITHLHDSIPVCPIALLFDEVTNTVCDRRGSCSAKCIYHFERGKGSNISRVLGSVAFNLAFLPLYRRMIKLSDALICTSSEHERILTSIDGSLRSKLHLIYNPLPETSLVEIKDDAFGYFGGPSSMKGFHVLLQAMKTLREPSIRVHATGFAQNRQTALLLKNQPNIVPFERVKYDELDDFYKNIRCVLFPSIVPEPLPYVVAEAMMRGRLLIASDTGGIPEQVEGCQGAFLFETGRHDQLAQMIRYVHGLSRETAIDLGMKNRDTFLKKFNNKTASRRFALVAERIAH